MFTLSIILCAISWIPLAIQVFKSELNMKHPVIWVPFVLSLGFTVFCIYQEYYIFIILSAAVSIVSNFYSFFKLR
jgi:hypothetical protein